MKNTKKLLLAILVFVLVFSNAPYFLVSATAQTGTATSKITANTYNGILKTKNNKYGIELTQKDGTKKYVVFDSKGENLAKKLITEAKLKNGAEISVIGVIKNNILQVNSIRKKLQKTVVQTYTGWLGDSDCSPNLEDPSVMGFKCLKCPHCEASGYGISVKQADGKYKYYKFDANGHKLAKENIVAKLTEKKVPQVAVKGTISGNIIKVKSFSVKN